MSLLLLFQPQPVSSGLTTYVNEPMASAPSTGTDVNASASTGWNVGGWYQLTNNVNQWTDYEYNGTLPTAFTSKVDMQMGVTNGADGCWFYYGFATSPQTESSAGGYLINRNDFSNTIEVRYNGTTLNSVTYTKDTSFDTFQVDVSGQTFTILTRVASS